MKTHQSHALWLFIKSSSFTHQIIKSHQIKIWFCTFLAILKQCNTWKMYDFNLSKTEYWRQNNKALINPITLKVSKICPFIRFFFTVFFYISKPLKMKVTSKSMGSLQGCVCCMCWAGNDRGAGATELRLQAKTNRPTDWTKQKKSNEREQSVQQSSSVSLRALRWECGRKSFPPRLSAHFSTRLDGPEPPNKHLCEDLRG